VLTNMLGKEMETCLKSIAELARKRHHEFLTVEHLLLGLLDVPSAVEVLCAVSVAPDELRTRLASFIDAKVPVLPHGQVQDAQPTLEFQRVVQRAVLHVQSSGRKEVEGRNVLVALFGERESQALYFLHEAGVTRLDVVNFISYGIHKRLHQPTTAEAKGGSASKLVRELNTLTHLVASSAAACTTRPPTLFISYSHADEPCLNRLLIHLRPLHRSKAVVCWSDKSIRIGHKWRNELKNNLDDASIAILLVSADFLASDFIVNNELPPLLLRAESRGLKILPVVLKPCGFARDPVLSSFQAANDPMNPLLGLSHIEQELIYDRIAAEVMQEIQLRQT
jgi:hypothetical protein